MWQHACHASLWKAIYPYNRLYLCSAKGISYSCHKQIWTLRLPWSWKRRAVGKLVKVHFWGAWVTIYSGPRVVWKITDREWCFLGLILRGLWYSCVFFFASVSFPKKLNMHECAQNKVNQRCTVSRLPSQAQNDWNVSGDLLHGWWIFHSSFSRCSLQRRGSILVSGAGDLVCMSREVDENLHTFQ